MRNGLTVRENGRVVNGSGSTKADPLISVSDEEALVGSILLGGDPTGIRTDIFSLPAHRSIVAAAKAMTERGEPVDVVLLKGELVRQGTIAHLGADPDRALTRLFECVPHVGHLEHYERRVRDLANRRRLRNTAEWMSREAESSICDIEDLREQIRLSDSLWEGEDAFEALSVSQLRTRYGHLKEVIVEGIVRRQEVLNIVGSTKTGKTWLVLGLALSVAAGIDWLGRKVQKPRNVLLLDNELQGATLRSRLEAVADGLGLQERDYDSRLKAVTLRNRAFDSSQLWRLVPQLKAAKPDLVILDSLYRFLPVGGNENDNSAMKDVLQHIIHFAEATDAAVGVVHHSTKGNQSEREVTDVGSGAGSISRAADTHLILRPHKVEGCAVMDFRARSFPPADPVVLRYSHPVWQVAEDLCPGELASPKDRRKLDDDKRDAAKLPDIVSKILKSGKQATEKAIRDSTGWNQPRAKRLLRFAIEAGGLVSGQHPDNSQWTVYVPSSELPP